MDFMAEDLNASIFLFKLRPVEPPDRQNSSILHKTQKLVKIARQSSGDKKAFSHINPQLSSTTENYELYLKGPKPAIVEILSICSISFLYI